MRTMLDSYFFNVLFVSKYTNCSFFAGFLFLFACILSGFRSATISAIKAATKRSMQLGGVPEEDIANKYNL